jgi:hypothetical protein
MANSASATITATQLDPTHWQYDIALIGTGSATADTLRFAWVSASDLLDTEPTGVTSPIDWAGIVMHGALKDRHAIQWVASSPPSDPGSGDTLGGFSFTSTDTPAAVFGNSVFYPTTPVPTSFVYAAAPESDAGFQFAATATTCFLSGTHILTNQGEVPIEDLKVGDTVVTASGGKRRICWVGHGGALATRGRRGSATPIIVRKSALGDNVPNEDLHVTKGHSLFFEDVLIPVELLVNHRSILWDDRPQQVMVYHLELDTHDILLANGAPAESYRDDGNRWMFKNARNGRDLPAAEAPCAPVLTGGPIVDAVWRRLLNLAGQRPGLPLTDDPDLHLLVDGTRLHAATQTDEVCIFNLAHVPREMRLVSRAAVPQELGLARDPRRLGVAVRRIVMRQGTRFRTFPARDPRLTEGFHAFEADHDFRWTDGDAILPTELFAGFSGPFEVVLHFVGATQYIAEVAASRVAAAPAGKNSRVSQAL